MVRWAAMEPIHVGVLLVLGLGAGVFGGLLGIGGSVIMIPVLGFILGWPFHLAQAAAMTVNPAVALTAALRHRKAKNVSVTTVTRVIPLSIICISLAAWGSNQLQAAYLEAGFGLFLLWVLWDQLSALRPSQLHKELHIEGDKTTWTRAGLTGGVTGTMAGLLGIGGGLIQVPLLNRLCKLPLRKAIGSSSAIMFFTAVIGATVKDASLSEILENTNAPFHPSHAILGALCLIPGALLGGWIGAKISTSVPIKAIRIVFALLVAWASFKMFHSSLSALL
ncbi:MAG: sulfite exporter TauE/SafE family protein [Phycisphaerales bacterium]|nr:sulfite exporter TauE/SafE family protein [Phycisphaerales bacterium]